MADNGTPFFLWSIADAWQWVVHLPVLGFVTLLLIVAPLGLFAISSWVTWQDKREYAQYKLAQSRKERGPD